MGKMHEILAVESDREDVAKKITTETINTFSKKPEHFQGHTKSLKFFDEERNSNEGGQTEEKMLVTTVDEKLNYALESVARYYDVVLQKDLTNQKAVADLIVDGKTLATGLPATFLLGLEKKFVRLRDMFRNIPTLPPGVKWVKDESAGKGIYRLDHAAETFKTEKQPRHKILVEPTKEHRAEIEKWNENVNVGKYITEAQSGMISPAEKSERIARLDSLIRATKEARMRANTTEVVKANIGDKINTFIMAGKV